MTEGCVDEAKVLGRERKQEGEKKREGEGENGKERRIREG